MSSGRAEHPAASISGRNTARARRNRSRRAARPGAARLALLAFALTAATLALGVGSAHAQLLVKMGSFGTAGSGAGQFQTPIGVAVNQNGLVYVADSANARVEMFSPSGQFVLAFGWGVADGKAQSEVCTSNCQAGMPGSGPGQFSNPTTVAVDSTTGPSAFDVYVGDAGNNVVEKFNAFGGFLGTINGSTTPEGSFSSGLIGVAVDQSGNLWTLDQSPNITEFDNTGKFLQQWDPGSGNFWAAIAVDSTNGRVYARHGVGDTLAFTLTGTGIGSVDPGTGSGFAAPTLAVDPSNGDLYAAHETFVSIFDKTGAPIGTLNLPGATRSEGLAVLSSPHVLYASDELGNNVSFFAPPTTPSAPLIGPESTTNVMTSTATLNASVFPYGLDTTCNFQYVDDGTFQASGYTNATSVPCTPADLGSSITAYQNATANISGLSPGTKYHFRVVATNSKATVNGADTTFKTQGPPVVSGASASGITETGASVSATINPTGLDTSCVIQYVDNGHFQSSGYNNAQSAPCSPSDVGSSFSNQTVSGSISGLSQGTIYHFRAVATNSAGTTNGADETFQTHLPFLVVAGAFGSSGAADGEFFTPNGIAAGPAGVFVADSGNARVQKFNASGSFVSAWGWGVTDGKSQPEVCTTNCQAGIPGPGGGQFKNPTSIAVSGSRVVVGDSGTNQVDVFSTAGTFLTVISGATSPQGHFQNVTGVATDQAGNLWVSDAGTSNVLEFSPTGKFLQQWSDTVGSPTAIAVDSVRSAVYLINGGTTTRFTTTGTNPRTVDSGSGTALALDPSTGNLYVDHGNNAAVYAPTGINIDNLGSLLFTTNSQGLAYRPATGTGSRLYVTDASNNLVTVFGPRAQGRPFFTLDSATQTGKSTATLNATVVPRGFDTTCTFQYVDDANFQATGYGTATSVPCAPADLGSSFNYAEASANLTGLTPNTTYHFRVVAVNSAGTTTSSDQTFQQQFAWAPFDRCPVDDPTMVGADGVTHTPTCIASNSTNGSFTIGNLTTPTGSTNLQVGEVLNQSTGSATSVAPAGGAIISAPVQIPSLGVTATVENAGTPSNFNFTAGISIGVPIIAVPIKIQLTSTTLPLGTSCFIGTNQNPILLHPSNTDLSNASTNFFTFDPNGIPDPNGNLETIAITGAVQGDNTFSVPGATGCGTNGSLDSTVNAVTGLPSPAGNNSLVLDNASSDLVLPPSGTTGQQFANDWHVGFG